MDIWYLESQSKSACIETSPTYIQGTKFSSFHCMSLDKLLPRHTKENNSNQQPHFESKRIYPSQFLPSFPVFDHKVFLAFSVLKIVGPDEPDTCGLYIHPTPFQFWPSSARGYRPKAFSPLVAMKWSIFGACQPANWVYHPPPGKWTNNPKRKGPIVQKESR